MRKKLIPIFMAVMMLTVSVHAAESSEAIRGEDGATITVTDITPYISNFDGAIPADGTLPDILPLDVQIKTEDGINLLVKTYEVPPDTDLNLLIEQRPERGGVEYTLREVLKQTMPSGSDGREASQTVSVSAPSDKREDILPLLPESLEYDADGYAGLLLLDEGSISTEVESTKGYTYTVSDTKEYYGLDRNDPYLVPKTMEKNGISYSLADIKWSGGNENSPSSIYTATALYTGKATGQTADGYLITASYTGQVQKEVPGNVLYTIIYEPIMAPVIPDDFDWGKVTPIVFIVIGIGGLAVLAVFLVRWLRSRKKSNSGYGLPEYEPEARPARRKPHALGYMKRDGGIDNA